MTVAVRAVVLSACLPVALLFSGAIKQPIRRPTLDPAVPAIDLFEAIDRELVEVTVIPRNAREGNLFVTNRSAETVSVQVPETVAAVQVLRQFFQPGLNGAANAQAPNDRNVDGRAQPVAGGVSLSGRQGAGQLNQNRLPGALFSVPASRTVQLRMKTVCLAYGQPDPQPKMQYRLVKVEEVAADADLRETLRRYAAGEIDEHVAQAAAWHIKDHMTWSALAAERRGQAGGFPGLPLFTDKQIEQAQTFVERVREETAPETSERQVTGRLLQPSGR